MTKRIGSLLLAVLLLCSLGLTALAAEPAAATGISVNQTRNLMVGDSKLLVLTAQPDGAALPAVTWSSSNTAVAAVDQRGVVTGVKAGKGLCLPARTSWFPIIPVSVLRMKGVRILSTEEPPGSACAGESGSPCAEETGK